MAGFPATGGHAPPRRRRTGRPASWTADKRALFLTMLQTCLNVRRAVEAVGLSHRSAYDLKGRDPDFRRGWAEALDIGYQELELELLRQAIEGSERIEELRDENGALKQTRIVKSKAHGMALRLLQAHRGEVDAFRESRGEADGLSNIERTRAFLDDLDARLAAAENAAAGPREAE